MMISRILKKRGLCQTDEHFMNKITKFYICSFNSFAQTRK